MKESDQQHIDQLKQSYEQFNQDLQKYITDLIRNKHKTIAKDQIKELKEDKNV